VGKIENPALEQFATQIGREFVLAQVLIRPEGTGFELRHVADRHGEAATLRPLKPAEARALAQSTSTGAFRPLKSSPDLRRGWRLLAATLGQLETALNQLYPGAIADWYAARQPNPPVTHYRDYVQRQTGMYRITALLDDARAARVIRAGCHSRFCLKCRLWTVAGLAPDQVADKSLIPCLEPCAVLMEFARTAMRIEQEDKSRFDMAEGEAASLRAAVQTAIDGAEAGGVRIGDMSAPGNPRRLQWVLERLQPAATVGERNE
jgi:hypothetical protein